MNAALPGVHRRIETAAAALDDAKAALRPIPAKILATDLDPNAKRARPHLARRGLQMVLRLLAFNAEAWLAERLNAYLADPNEYRAIVRNLLHLGGQVDYATKAITITLDPPDRSRSVAPGARRPCRGTPPHVKIQVELQPPDSPRIEGAVALFLEQINNTPPHLHGDPDPSATASTNHDLLDANADPVSGDLGPGRWCDARLRPWIQP